jgi:nucleoside-diphosphate-sugar epimerase
VIHGSKWYGSHRGPYRTPAQEDQPRHPLPVFYYAQQDWLSAHQRGKDWTWSALRPHGIWGFAIGSQLHMMNAVAVYATLMKLHGLPLHFPGKPGAYDALYQCTEASHLAEAMVWAATAPAAANEAFNMTNGDFIRWRHAWPLIADWFEMDAGQVLGFDVAEFAAENAGAWRQLCEDHDLRHPDMHQLTTWDAAINYVFNADWDQMSALTKARRAGWSGAVDTYTMFGRQFERLVAERVIPDPRAALR